MVLRKFERFQTTQKVRSTEREWVGEGGRGEGRRGGRRREGRVRGEGGWWRVVGRMGCLELFGIVWDCFENKCYLLIFHYFMFSPFFRVTPSCTRFSVFLSYLSFLQILVLFFLFLIGLCFLLMFRVLMLFFVFILYLVHFNLSFFSPSMFFACVSFSCPSVFVRACVCLCLSVGKPHGDATFLRSLIFHCDLDTLYQGCARRLL